MSQTSQILFRVLIFLHFHLERGGGEIKTYIIGSIILVKSPRINFLLLCH